MIHYTASHEWVCFEEDQVATVGITDRAQKELGAIVHVELPQVGSVVEAGEEVVVLESTKAAIDIYTPLAGEVVAVNALLSEAPEKVNSAAESEGWLFKIRTPSA